MMVPKVKGSTIASTLMRDAVAVQMRTARAVRQLVFDSLTPQEIQTIERREGTSIDGVFRKITKNYVDRLTAGMKLDPAKTYRDIF